MKFKTIYAERAMAALQIAPAAAIITASFIPDVAFAAQDAGSTGDSKDILRESCGLVNTIKSWIFTIAYVLGAIGLVIIAISAFLGRFKFSHLIALGGGLFIVAGADMLIKFASMGENDGSNGCSTTWS